MTDEAVQVTEDEDDYWGDEEDAEVMLEMPTAREGSVERERHGVRLELSTPRYFIMKRLLDGELERLKEDITSKEFFEVFDLANYIRVRARTLKGLEDE